MRTKYFLSAFAAMFIVLNFASAQTPEEQPSWKMSARFLVADNCPASGCSCLQAGAPYHGFCRAVGVMEISDGHYGDVSLNGQHVGMTMEFSTGGTHYMAYYIDESASREVKKALRALLSAPPFGIVGEGFTIKETSVNADYVEGKQSSFSLGKYGMMTLTPMLGGDGKSQMKIVNPTYPFPVKEVYLNSAKGNYSDYGKELVLDGNSGEVSEFTLTGGGQ